ncbi:filamentous hemagglutinin N-terminal domain-containing protein [Anaerovibrio sp.]|uniref:two-partner secretion domain-containing protein n=1 Tax=Anaerovibrio sp. TaxID=1872532 RepID=UPI00388F06B5
MTNRNLLSKKIILGLATATLCYGPFGVGYAEVADNALPTGGSISHGTATISTNEENNTMNVLQSTDKAIIDWNSFNVGRDATVNFIQTLNGKPNVAAMTLNRVNAAGGMSEIAGHINSIGSFLLVNPNGTMFYDGSEVNAAGVIVSTAEIDEGKFLNGQLSFAQNNTTNANITVNGTINASTNGAYMEGLLGMVKNDIENSPLNTEGIELATGFSFANNTIKLVADGDINVGEKGSLQAVTSTTISGDKTVGSEAFSVEGDSSTRTGSITLRADQNADDINSDGVAAKVYLNNADASQIASHSVGIYYNPDLVEHEVDGETKTINGAKVADLKDSAGNQAVVLADDSVTYTQKDYTKYDSEASAYKSKVAQSFNEFSRTEDKTIKTSSRGIISQSYNMLVNNLYQMEAIQYSDKANMSGSYAQGRTFNAADTANWNAGKGFKSIGTVDNPFKGSFTGSGGSNGYSILDLTINRSTEDNIGLFGVANGASFWSMNLVDSNIIGKNNVGGIAGQATDHSKFSSISVRKSIPANNVISETNNITGNDNVGGIVGEISNGGTIRFSSNNAQIGGVDKVGGLVGSLSGEAAGGSDEGSNNNIYKSSNSGVIQSSGTSAGGLAGYINSTLNTKDNKFATGENITTDPTENLTAVAITDSYSNGKVSGTTDVGGIVGTLENGTIQYTYNTNENAALSSSSVVSEASVGAGTSVYGKVNGNTNVGGIVGNMTGGIIDQSYNAGNIEGSTNVGGVVGSMFGGSITKAYNADNNTVLKTSTNDAEYYGFKVIDGEHAGSYTYNHDKQVWMKGSEELTSEQLNAIPETQRVYNNRLAYRDATVTGTENVGGIVGIMSNGSMEQVYNAGQVKSNEGASNVGAFVGKYEAGTINDSFYVTTENDGTTNITNQAKAVGNDVAIEGITAKILYQAQNINDTTWTGGKNTGNGWTIYNNSSTPLLNHFMRWININRQYEYDGTVHNLMTTDVANYYGGAFFDNGDGKNVYSKNYGLVKDVITGGYKASDWVIKSGSANADTSHSSVYTYDNSTMWSPQHGYYTSDDARMIITPKTLKVSVTGGKTYGNNAVKGAEFADNYVADSGKYAMKITTDFAKGDTLENLYNVDATDVNYNSDSNSLDAGTYTTGFTNPIFTKKNKDNYNYRIAFTDKLIVNKARLDVGLVGTKKYGEDTSKGIYEYYALRRNTDSGSDTLNNGNLKSFDYHNDKNNIPVKNEGKKAIPSDKITKLEANTNVTNAGKDTESRVIDKNTDILIHKESDGKYAIYSYKLGDVELDGKDIEKNYELHYSNEGTLDIVPDNVVTKRSGSKTLPDNFTPETNPEMFREILSPVKSHNTAHHHPDVFENIDDEHFAEQIQETAEESKNGATEESKKIRYSGYNPKEARDGIRFITVEETGINVEDARIEHTTITIDPDSLVDGNNEVVIDGSVEAEAE